MPGPLRWAAWRASSCRCRIATSTPPRRRSRGALLTRDGHEVVFATEAGGAAPAADALLLDGALGTLGAADRAARLLRRDGARRRRSSRPIAWSAIEPDDFDGLDPARRPRAGHEAVPRLVAAAGQGRAPSGAPGGPSAPSATASSCSRAPRIRRRARACSHGARTTCLPKYMERGAYLMTFWKLGRYYRTYPAYVEDEVRAALGDAARAVRARPARRARSAAPTATTSAPSSSRTGATSRRAGPATPIYSRAASPPASRIRRAATRSATKSRQRLAARRVVGRAQDRRRVHGGERVRRPRRRQVAAALLG